MTEQVFSTEDLCTALMSLWRMPSAGRAIFKRWGPPAGLVVCQHADGLWQDATVTGEPIRAWRRSSNGMAVELEPDRIPEQAATGPWYQDFAIWRFCVCRDTMLMILCRLSGPRAATGGVYEIQVTEQQPEFVRVPGVGWKA